VNTIYSKNMIAAIMAVPIVMNKPRRCWLAPLVTKTAVEGLGAGVFAKLAINEPVVVATAPTLTVTDGDADAGGITMVGVLVGVGILKVLTTLLQNASAAGST
jgi:hypothetical protein